MHSSGMHSARLLTVSQHAMMPCAKGVYQACTGGCIKACTGQGVSAQGVPAQGGGVCPGVCGRHPYGQTDTCENITFANFVCGW